MMTNLSYLLISVILKIHPQTSNIYYEYGKRYTDTIIIAYETNNNFSSYLGFYNAFNPAPRGFIIYDGEITETDYKNKFFIMAPIQTILIDSSNIDTSSLMDVNDYMYLDSLFINSLDAKAISIKNRDIKYDGKALKNNYKLYKVIVECIYLGQLEINKPILSNADTFENKFTTNVFMPTQFISIIPVCKNC